MWGWSKNLIKKIKELKDYSDLKLYNIDAKNYQKHKKPLKKTLYYKNFLSCLLNYYYFIKIL